jgi:hypothetical protein
MKKILLLLSFSVVLLSSCSSDDSSPSESQPLLLKTMTEGDVLFGQTVTHFTYNGNKLVEIFKDGDDDYADVYTYTGDLITKIEKFAVYDAGTPSEDRQLLSTDQFIIQLVKQKNTGKINMVFKYFMIVSIISV